MRVTRGIAAIVVALMGWMAVSASGYPITFAFSGVITKVANDGGWLDSSVAVGVPYHGTYTFESTATDSNPTQYYGWYYFPAGAPYTMSVWLGNYQFQGPATSISVSCYPEKGYYDLWSTEISSETFANSFMGVGLNAPGVLIPPLQNDSLPLYPPDPALFPTSQLSIHAVIADGDWRTFSITGSLDEIVRVPEPNAALILFGLAACSGRLRRRTAR